MISNVGHKRKSSSSLSMHGNHSATKTTTTTSGPPNPMSTLTKRFRGIAYDGKINHNEHRLSLPSTALQSEQPAKKMTVANGDDTAKSKRLDESEMTPAMLAEYRRLQHELQCQEALLVLMQKLKANQRLISQTNNNGIKQRTTATKLSQQQVALPEGKNSITATKQQQQQHQPQSNSNRSTPTKTPHPNQYTVNRSNQNSQLAQQQSSSSSKTSLAQPQATRQSNHVNNNVSSLPAAATRISATLPASATKNSSVPSTTSNSSSKSNGVAAEQHLLNAKLALRKQLEQTLLQIPTPKPSTCDLTFIPGLNGWSEFLAYLGLEQALNTYTDIVNRRPPSEISMNLPHVCAQCGTDWSVTWHEMSSGSDTSTDEKILCDRCTKTSQKKLLKQDHSNRLRQAFIKALQQEKELDAKFQQSSSSTTTSTVTSTTATSAPATAVKQSSSHHHHQQVPSKHAHTANKHSSKPLSTKTSSNHNHHHNSSTNNNNNSSNNNNNNHHSHHHHHHHSSKSSSSSSKSHHANASALASLNPTSAESLASTLAALQSSEHMDFFQKHFLSNMLPFAVANQAAAAYAAKSSQQQQALAALPAMAASLMRQPNPAQYLLDMIPQATKQQQQQHHHHHSK